MQIKTVALDCDGVILESVNVKTRAFGRVVEEFGPKAVDMLISYHLDNGGVSRFEKFAWFYREFLGREITVEESARLGELFSRYCHEGVLKSSFVPGAFEFIQEYSSRLSLYVVSGTPQEELSEILEARGLDGYFCGLHGTPPSKTDLLADVLRKSGFASREILMVGDSFTDLQAAEEVGTQFYGRGKDFAHSGWPWGEDLFSLGEYLGSGKRR